MGAGKGENEVTLLDLVFGNFNMIRDIKKKKKYYVGGSFEGWE